MLHDASQDDYATVGDLLEAFSDEAAGYLDSGLHHDEVAGHVADLIESDPGIGSLSELESAIEITTESPTFTEEYEGQWESFVSDMAIVASRYYAAAVGKRIGENFREEMLRTLDTLSWEDMGPPP